MNESLRVQSVWRADEHGTPRLHIMLWREDHAPIRLGWDALQAEVRDAAAASGASPRAWFAEYFPPAEEVVNRENVRHFWEIDEPGGDCRF